MVGACRVYFDVPRSSERSAARCWHRAARDSLERYAFRAADRGGTPIRADAIVTINWIITPAVIARFTEPTAERDVGGNLAHQRKLERHGSYLQNLEQDKLDHDAQP